MCQEGCILDGQGIPTTDPQAFYASPPGAILPLGGHKGFALGVIVEVLAGAISGGSCSRPGTKVVSNNMLTIVIDPARLPRTGRVRPGPRRFHGLGQESRPRSPPTARSSCPASPSIGPRPSRLKEGIPLDETTWNQLQETARSLNVPVH